MELRPLPEQVVVVIGASSGIGRETALRTAGRGARVVVSARGGKALAQLVAEITDRGGRALAVTADVTEPAGMEAVAAAAAEHFGGIDTWVHAAAVMLYARFEDTTPEEFRRIVEVDLLGQVHGALAALPHLRRRGGGALIHVASVESRRALPYNSAYAAAKHGINGFVQALRVELQEEGVPIAVTNVMPASINTPLYARARSKIGVMPIPVPPLYEPGTVADVILHAAEHPSRDLIAGGAGSALLLGEHYVPRLLDQILVRVGFRLQETSEPRTADAPDNLYHPVPGYGASRGPYRALKHSAYNWVQTRSPLLTWRR